jgi:uncharacterized protein involved in copper resistance
MSFDGIRRGESWLYRFQLKQSGTYWYHSHSGFQEQAGLRLRYEISRKFAPYLGWSYVRYFGESADLRHLADEAVRENQFVAGFRAWF